MANARFVALLDLDGLLCDMEPFAHELRTDTSHRQRWKRFFAHTPEATAIPAGVDLVLALQRARWRYAVSTTRPRSNHQMVCRWLADNLPVSPEWVYTDWRGADSVAAAKRLHYLDALVSAAPPCALFIDDEASMVDALIDLDVPAMHIDELAGLSDDQLAEVLKYSTKDIDERRRQAQKSAQERGEVPTMRDRTKAAARQKKGGRQK